MYQFTSTLIVVGTLVGHPIGTVEEWVSAAVVYLVGETIKSGCDYLFKK